MIVDTGCSRTTVWKNLVSPSKVQGNTKDSQITNGEWINCKLAKVELDIGEKYSTEVAVAERLAVLVLLGRDLPIDRMIAQRLSDEEFREILQKRQEQQFVVTTRARAQREGPMRSRGFKRKHWLKANQGRSQRSKDLRRRQTCRTLKLLSTESER